MEQLDLFDESAPRKGEYEVPEGAKLTPCGSCRAGMVWAETASGRRIPLSAKTIQTRGAKRYALPHFTDCPQAKDWSKR